MGFLSILGTIGEVAGIASNVLKTIGGSGNTESARRRTTVPGRDTYDQGPLSWQANQKGDVFVQNTSDDPVGLSYTMATPNTDLSVYQPLDAGAGYDATQDLHQFPLGLLTIAPTPASTRSNFPTLMARGMDVGRAIAFSIRLLSVGVFVTIVKGIQVSVKPGKLSLKFLGKPPKNAHFSAQVSDSVGTTMNVEGSIDSSTQSAGADGVYEFDLPPGLVIETVANLSIDLMVDEATFLEATRERASRQVTNR